MHTNSNTKGTHLTARDRQLIEIWFNNELLSRREIARRLNHAPQTINNEIKNRSIQILDSKTNFWTTVYVATAAQKDYERNKRRSGRTCVLTEESKALLVQSLDGKDSPDIVGLRLGFATSSIYYWINHGILDTSREQALIYPRKQKIKSQQTQGTRSYGTSIDERPEEINNRIYQGDFEIDTVVPIREKCEVLLTLTDRKTRFEVIRLISGKTAEAVNTELLSIAKDFNIRSITADNGSEFAKLTELDIPILCSRLFQLGAGNK